MKKIFFLMLILILPRTITAEEITNNCVFQKGYYTQLELKDGNIYTKTSGTTDDSIDVVCRENIESIYIIYDGKVTRGELTNKLTGKKIPIGEKQYLHEFVELNKEVSEFNLSFNDNFTIADIHIFNSKDVPKWVQKWENNENADLMLFSTHSDDEHLFFAGLIPKYVNEGKKIQVAYFTHHKSEPNRQHELLNGLWAVGLKYYPTFNKFPDEYSKTSKDALTNFNNNNIKRTDLVNYYVRTIREYKPYVVVGHDEQGEYGHGQHILNTEILKEAIDLAATKTYHAASYSQFQEWNVQKVYLHLYSKNQIVLDYNVPLNNFNNLTAFQVSQKAFLEHKSQQGTWFKTWLYGTNNEITNTNQITKYNPSNFGLYKSSVGEDTRKNDLFENVTYSREYNKSTDNKETSEDKYTKDKYTKILFTIILVCIPLIIIFIVFKLLKK